MLDAPCSMSNEHGFQVDACSYVCTANGTVCVVHCSNLTRMFDGVDRLVDLVGIRTCALRGGSATDVADAVARGDVGRLARTDGHFAATGREERTVRLAR